MDDVQSGAAAEQVTAPAAGQPAVQTESASESTTPVVAEKTFSQSQVQAIAAKEARKAEERGEARARAQYEARMQQQQAPQQSQPASVGGMPQMSQEDIQRLIRQEAHTMSLDYQARQIEENWMGAMEAEKTADPEFADLYDAIGIEQQPGLVLAMAGMDNKAKVVKDLAKNPSKYANILTLANGGSPKLAQMELKKLSDSIRANDEAMKKPKVDAPLSQVRASNLSGDDGNYSNMSTTDFRNQPWLRG